MQATTSLQPRQYLVPLPFLIGMVLCNLLSHILPETLEHGFAINIAISFLAGLGLQHFLHSFLSHRASGNQFLWFLHIHNLTDGFVIGLAFLSGPTLGLSTVFAVLLHDIIHKIIGFSFLREQGDQLMQALTKIASTFISIFLGAILVFSWQASDQVHELGSAFAAGSLSYIVYLLLKRLFGDKYDRALKVIYLILGASLMLLLINLLESLPGLH